METSTPAFPILPTILKTGWEVKRWNEVEEILSNNFWMMILHFLTKVFVRLFFVKCKRILAYAMAQNFVFIKIRPCTGEHFGVLKLGTFS